MVQATWATAALYSEVRDWQCLLALTPMATWSPVGMVLTCVEHMAPRAQARSCAGGEFLVLLDPETGIMRTGWRNVGDTWYFLDAFGAIATGWMESGGAWYYMDANGAMLTG